MLHLVTANMTTSQPQTENRPARTLVTIATYNEIENLPLLVDAIWEVASQVDILVIDDNSPDGTGSWCDEQAKTEPRLHCLHRAGKLGLGTATIAGMKYAIEHDYDLMLNMDADFSHHPRHLAAVFGCMNSADVAIGSRYVPGGDIIGWSLKRHVMSQGINVYSRALLDLRTNDCSGAFRCYRIAKLREIDFTRFRSRGYAFQEEMLYRCARVGCRIAETPITFEDRIVGQSKINFREMLRAVRDLFLLGLDRLRDTPVRIDV